MSSAIGAWLWWAVGGVAESVGGSVGGVWTWAWLVLASVAPAVGVVTNVVKEVPSLDVGPLVVVKVARGDTARLPCGHPEARHPGDHMSLVLWYRDHTSRPFLSYDARNRSLDLLLNTEPPSTTTTTPSTTTTTTTSTTTSTTTTITTTTTSGPYLHQYQYYPHYSNNSIANLYHIPSNSSNSSRGSRNRSKKERPSTRYIRSSSSSSSSTSNRQVNTSNTGEERPGDAEAKDKQEDEETDGKEEGMEEQEDEQEEEEEEEEAEESKQEEEKDGGNDGVERRFLEEGGTTLVVEGVREEDESEYRCRVHFRLSPTWTRRLLLLVPAGVRDVTILDEGGREVGGRLKPVAEGANITLTCRAAHGKARVVGLTWLLDGEEIDSTWARGVGVGVGEGVGVAVNTLHLLGVEERHRGAHLTCRLTTTPEPSPPPTTADLPVHAIAPSALDPQAAQPAHTAANITYASTRIAMFYVPEASLRVEDGRGGAGANVEVVEGDSVTFLCRVTADPPAYNITWLHNGRVVGVGGRRWRRDRASLVVSPVERTDAGLYTCLASNREGDGHSNAVLLRVTHPPYCAGPQGSAPSHVVVAANTSVSLRCRMEAVPLDVSFVWRVGPPLPPRGYTGQLNVPPHQQALGVGLGQPAANPAQLTTQDTPDGASVAGAWEGPWREAWKQLESGEGVATVEGRRDPAHADASSLTLTPGASTVVGCFARNKAGHTRVPCRYTLTVVEPPKALTSCNVTLLDVTRMEVKCQDPAPADAPPHAHPGGSSGGGSGEAAAAAGHPHVHHASPSLSFVRSPGASSTKANMEVWSGNTLVANVSSGRPQFSVRGLPPDTELRLVLYTATPHARSKSLRLHARTLPRKVAHFTVPPPPARPAHTRAPPAVDDPAAPSPGPFNTLGWEVAGGVGGACVALLLLVALLGVARVWRRRRRSDGLVLDETAAGGGIGVLTGGGGDSGEEHQHLQHHAALVSTTSEESTWAGLEWQSSVM